MDEPKRFKKILLIDGHGLAFRGFYALPEMNAPDGTPTNAVLGFMNMLLKAMEEWKPDAVGLVFDPQGPTARDAMYDAYKEGRAPTPDAFKVQMPLILELAGYLGYPIFIRDGVEADDLIASTAIAANAADAETVILSADKDLLQLLHGKVTMARPSKGISEFKLYDEQSFSEEYGFAPPAMADYLALVGDSVDNIPGVAGIGDKTARGLLSTYGSLDEIYEHLADLPKGQCAKLEQGKDAAYRSYELVIPQKVSPIDLEQLRMNELDRGKAARLCHRLGLKKLMERLGLNDGDLFEGEKKEGKATGKMAKEVSFSQIATQNVLAIACPETIVTMSCNREWAILEQASQLEKWLESIEGALLLADYRAWYELHPFLKKYQHRIFDVELAHYFFHPDAKFHSISKTSDTTEEATDICTAIFSLWEEYGKSELLDEMTRVMREIDVPLIPVLVGLQREGLSADIELLRRLESDLNRNAAQIEREIFEVAEGVINLNSPKQVGELLFEKLRLPVVKKTKTGYSTDVSVLEELSRLPEPLNTIPSKMLEFRECSKMLSGFVQPFIKYATESRDGRVHSTFLHNVTGTGRLASRDPNVQNLPVFGEWADAFRQSIKPRGEARVFVAADYSQIELRVLAHLSGEERLLEAFQNDRDIHLETASWVFDLDPEDVTPEQRRFAKTVNFGLIYGMGAHGLAVRMGIPRHQAANLVERYFSVLPKVKQYLERSAKDAKARGYTRSIFGRIRPLAEVATVEGRGGNPIDRVAVNTPIQSTAADIAKIALIRFHAVLREKHPDASLVLQVHDSLICDAPKDEAGEIEALLVETMEAVKAIDVPLKADAKRGVSLADV